jgi:uncharacterized protein (TIRG00374 family)
MRTGWKYTLSIVAGLAILGGVLYVVGWRRILAQMHALGALGILAILANTLLAMALWILCWWIILRSYGARLPLGRVIGARFSGYAVSYLTPTLYFGGEPVRALLVAGSDDVPTTRIFATIVVERFLGGLSMIVFILVGSFHAMSSPQLPWSQKRIMIAGVAFITFWIVVGLINFAWNYKWISRSIRFLGVVLRRWRRPLHKAADKVSETEDEIHYAFTKHRKGTIAAFLVQTAATFLVYMRPQVFFGFSEGIRLTFLQLSLLFTFGILISSFLWITPGGLGTGEAAQIGIFRLVAPAVTAQGVVAYSLMFKFAEILLVAGGLYYLAQRGIRRLDAGGSERPSSGGT